MSNQTFYRVSNLDGRLANPDHCLTDDITSFSSACAHLYSHISKPLLDVIAISTSLIQLSAEQQANTIAGPLLGGVVILLTGRILRLVSPKFGVLVAEEAARKGYLRYTHSRLTIILKAISTDCLKNLFRIITNSEEIAFYDGQKVELSNLTIAFKALVEQSNKIFLQKLWYIMLEQFLMK